MEKLIGSVVSMVKQKNLATLYTRILSIIYQSYLVMGIINGKNKQFNIYLLKSILILGIVPSVATTLKRRFVLFLQ